MNQMYFVISQDVHRFIDILRFQNWHIVYPLYIEKLNT